MAFVVEDSSFTHVIAIDFGTGASGYYFLVTNLIRYGIAARINQTGQKPRIEVFNPVDENDDQKTTTTILFNNEQKFVAFGSKALQVYAEMVEDGDSAYLFQTVINKKLKLV